jgi:hypothetical protein
MLMTLRILQPIACAALLFALLADPTLAAPVPGPCAHCAAPGPIAGAGLPILAMGGGVYWLAKWLRRRRTRPR